MLKKKYKWIIFIGIIIVIILVGSYIIYKIYGMSFDYMVYGIKTFGQEKYRLTLYVKYEIGEGPAYYVPINVIQETDFGEGRITSKKTNMNGRAVFYLLPGTYKFQGGEIFLGSTRYIVLDTDKEITLRVWIPIQ